jgi:hypothetical protein
MKPYKNHGRKGLSDSQIAALKIADRNGGILTLSTHGYWYGSDEQKVHHYTARSLVRMGLMEPRKHQIEAYNFTHPAEPVKLVSNYNAARIFRTMRITFAGIRVVAANKSGPSMDVIVIDAPEETRD